MPRALLCLDSVSTARLYHVLHQRLELPVEYVLEHHPVRRNAKECLAQGDKAGEMGHRIER